MHTQTPDFHSSESKAIDDYDISECIAEMTMDIAVDTDKEDDLVPAAVFQEFHTEYSSRAAANAANPSPGKSTVPLRFFSNPRYNTTSSVYATNTIASPDINQILFWYVCRHDLTIL